MKYVLSLLLMLVSFSANSAGLNCSEYPSCKSLGYSKEGDPNCPKGGYIYCPFDRDYKKCALAKNTDCASLGFTKADKKSWCGSLVECPSDSAYTLCSSPDKNAKNCEIGYVFYSDDSCSSIDDYDPSSQKKPIGVVFWLENDVGSRGKIVNLKDLTFIKEGSGQTATYSFDPQNPYDNSVTKIPLGVGNMDFTTITDAPTIYTTADLKPVLAIGSDAYDLPVHVDGLINTSNLFKLEDGTGICKEITQGIENDIRYCSSLAAEAAIAFYPDTTTNANNHAFGPGQWWIPTIGELTRLYGINPAYVSAGQQASGADSSLALDKVNDTLEQLAQKGVDAAPVSEAKYWSSTPASGSQSWVLRFSDGYRSANTRSAKLTSASVNNLRVVTSF